MSSPALLDEACRLQYRQLQDRLNLSSRTLERRLRDLRQGTHLAEAKRLLGSSSMSVSETAHRLGYADASSFTCAFKVRTGLTPASGDAPEAPPGSRRARHRGRHPRRGCRHPAREA